MLYSVLMMLCSVLGNLLRVRVSLVKHSNSHLLPSLQERFFPSSLASHHLQFHHQNISFVISCMPSLSKHKNNYIENNFLIK